MNKESALEGVVRCIFCFAIGWGIGSLIAYIVDMLVNK